MCPLVRDICLKDKEGCFVRRWSKMKKYIASKAVDRLREEKPKKSITMRNNLHYMQI